MRATLNGTVIAEAPEEDLVRIEGNWYFPPASVDFSLVTESPTPYTCPWKGACQYYHVVIDGTQFDDRAWAYPSLYDGAIERVGKDFSSYVAFARDVEVGD
jgi:uncharacterized protein (DUF427 family)